VPFGTLEEGIPLFYGPDLSTGVVDLPTTANMVSAYRDRINRGYIQSWNLTFERRLPWDMSLAAGYVGTMTTHQLGYLNINAAGAGEGRAGQPLFEPFGRTAWTGRFDGWLSANYHSLQVDAKGTARGVRELARASARTLRPSPTRRGGCRPA